jgi:hypothetical protein
MILTLSNAREQLLADDELISVAAPYLGGHKKPLKDFFKQTRRKFKVLRELQVELSNGEVITIERGFKTDLCSVPRWLWAVASPYNDALLAFVIHDWLYINLYENRYFADKEMLLWCEAINANHTDNVIRYHAVRWKGESWWQRNEERVAREATENVLGAAH